MDLVAAKQELIKRYIYLWENRAVILLPYINDAAVWVGVDLKIFDELTSMLEEFLLSDKPFEESDFYKYIEAKKAEQEFKDMLNQKLAKITTCQLNTDLNMRLIFENLIKRYINIEQKHGHTIDSFLAFEALKQYYVILDFEPWNQVDNQCNQQYFNFRIQAEPSQPRTIARNTFTSQIHEFVEISRRLWPDDMPGTIFGRDELMAILAKYPKYDSSSNPVCCNDCGNVMNLVNILITKENEQYYQTCPHCSSKRIISSVEYDMVQKKLPHVATKPNTRSKKPNKRTNQKN